MLLQIFILWVCTVLFLRLVMWAFYINEGTHMYLKYWMQNHPSGVIYLLVKYTGVLFFGVVLLIKLVNLIIK